MPPPSRMRERLFSLFLLGVLLLAPPVLIVFNTSTRFLGVPTLYLYLFAAWAALIALVALVVERVAAMDDLAEIGREPTVQLAKSSGAEPRDA